MFEFDVENYFDRRAYNDLTVIDPETKQTKYQALQAASLEKVNQLKQRNAGSVVSILQDITGTDNTGMLAHDGLIGAPINNTVALGSGLSKLTGFIASGIHDLDAMYLNKDIPQQVKDARARMLTNTATAEDEALLAMPRGDVTQRAAPKDYTQELRKDFTTNLKQIMDMETSLDRAAILRKGFDLSSAVHSGDKDKLTQELGERAKGDIARVRKGVEQFNAGDLLDGTGNVLAGVGQAMSEIPGAAANNPMGSFTFLAENAANLAASGLGRIPQAISNIGYGLDTFGQGTEDFREKNAGAIPSNTELLKNAALAGTAVGAEYLGDKMMGITDLFSKGAKAIDPKSALKQALGMASNPVTRTVGATVKGGTGEFFTEGYQAFAENTIKNEATSLEQAYEGGAIGAIVGGAMATPAHLARELTGTTDGKLEKRAEDRKQQAGFAAMAKANDASTLVDPAAKTYNPEKAVQVWFEHAKAADTTPEVKQANLLKARELVQNLEATQERNVRVLDIASTPSALSEAKEELVSLKEQRIATDPDNKPRVDVLDQQIAIREEAIALSADKVALKRLSGEVKRSEQQLSSTKTLQENFADSIRKNATVDEVATHIAKAIRPMSADNMPDIEESRQSVQALVNIAMVSPNSISVEDANNLVSNKNSALTPEQRDYFRQFSEARIAENNLMNLDKVHQAIFTGTAQDTGIVEYRRTIGQALEAGDQKAAEKSLLALQTFAQNHAEKQGIATKLFSSIRVSGDKQVLRVKTGGWEVVPAGKPLKDDVVKANGGFKIHPNSGEFVGNMQTEVVALNQVVKEQQAAFTLRFGSAPEGIVIPPIPVATTATQAPSAGVAAAKGAAVVGGATQTNTEAASVKIPESTRYQLTQSPAYEGLTALSIDDANFELEVLSSRAAKGKLTPDIFAQSEIGKRLDANTIGLINTAIKSDPVAAIAALQNHVSTPVTPANTSVAPVQKAAESVQVAPVPPTVTPPSDTSTKVDMLPKEHGAAFTLLQGALGGEITVDIKTPGKRIFNFGDISIEETPVTENEDIPYSIVVSDLRNPVMDETGKFAFPRKEFTSWREAVAHVGSLTGKPVVQSKQPPQTPSSNLSVTEQAEGTARPDSDKEVIAKAKQEKALKKEIALIEKEIKRAEKLLKRLGKNRNGMSLWSALKHSLKESDLVDVYGSGWKKYTLLKGKPGVDLSTRVANGDLDAFLPFNLNSQAIQQDGSLETEAAEYIKTKLGQGDYLTEDTKFEMEKLGLSLEELEQQLTILNITEELDHAENEIPEDNETSSEQDQEAASQEPAGSAAASAGKEEATDGTESAVKTPANAGTLSIFAQYVANPFAAISGVIPSVSEVFKTVNLVAQYFKQSGVNETNVTNRPLVAVKDFLTAWENKEASVKDFLDIPKEEKISDEQKAALSNLAKTIKSWFPAIQSNFKKFTGNMDFKMTDMMQYLYTEEGGLDVDENVKTAIGYSAYHWIVDKANSPMFLTKEQISEMHNQDKDAAITEDGVQKLQRMASYEHTAIAELGKVAVQALGLKLKDDAPVDLLPRLESALGVHVLSLLENAGYLTKVALPASQVNSYFDEETSSEFSEFTTYNYVQLVVKEENKKTVHTDAVRAIKDANFGSSDVASKLFGIEVAPRMPETTPAKFVQKTAKDSQQDIPKAQRKAVQDTMNTPHTVIPEMWAAAEKLGRGVILKIAGAKDIDSGKYHKENRSSIDAQNRNLETQFDLMSELLNQTSNKEGLDQAFYVAQSVWKNFRAGFSNQGLNLQTSKIHRFMFGRPNWTVKIDFDNQELVNEFLVSVAMALGVKTDQQRNTKTLNLFMEKLAKEPKVLEAVRVLQEGLEQGNDAVFTTKNIELVQDVASNAEGMMSLQAMVAFAKYLQARETNQTGFTTTMLVGADGKTNGPMLTLLALGAAEFDTLNRGGFYSTADGQAKHFSEYFEGVGAMDLYQDLGMAVLTSAKTKLTSAEEIQKLHKQKRSKFAFTLSTYEQFAAFQVLTKALDKDGKVTSAMRNLTKTPLTSFFFGSSLGSSVRGMENAFIEGYYTALEDLAQGKRTDGTTLKSFIEATNVLLAKSKGAPINPALDIEQMLEMSLTKAQEKALRNSFNVIMGASVKTTMTEYFDTFIGRRDALNKTIQAAYETYAAVYAEAYNKELADLMEAGKIAYRTVIKGKDTGKKVPLHGLTVAQERVLRLRIANLVPVMHTAYSQKEDNLRAGVYMAKTEVDKSKSTLYANTVYTQGGDIGAQSHTRVEVSPGVAGLPYSMHSLDSFIMHLALNSVAQSMNVHDEGANGVDKVGGKDGVAHALNKNTIEALLEYSPAQEAVVMLERLVTGMADRIAKESSTAAVAKDMLTKWQEIINRNVPDEEMVAIEDVGMEMLRRSVRNAYEASYARLTHISEMGSVDQYTWEGGQFTVTPEIRQRAVFLRDQLDKSASPEFQEAIKALNKAAFAVTAEPAPIDESANVVPAAVPADPLPVGTVTPWGVVGKPRIESDAALVSMFEATPVMTAKQVLKALRDRLQAEGKPNGTTKFQFALIQKLYTILPDDLKIKYITSANTLEDVLDAPASNARGWYVNRGIDQEIYVLSPEFVNSGLEVETLLHEMLHAALLYVTAMPTAATKELVAELEALRQAAMDFATKNDLAKRFAPALANLDEFLAWGMSNVEFQTKVLNKVTTLTTKTQSNAMVTGMKKFIGLISKLLFKDASSREQELMSNGLSILIANVSGLFEQAANNQNKTLTGTTNLSMAAQINAFTTTEIHDALDEGKVSPAFNEHLKEILNTIVDKLHGPANAFKDAIAKGVASTPSDVFNEAISTGVAPFTSELQASGFLFNNQTFFVAEQVEATVKALLDSKDNKMAAVREELRKLEAEVRGKLKPQDFFEGDWFQATKDEREQATALHSYLFKKVDGDYLARFAALGLSHEGFNALLKTPTKLAPVTQKDRSIEGTLTRLFSKMLNAVNGKFITHTRSGQPADDKLAALVRQLVEIENRNKNTLKSPLGGIMDFADNRTKAARQGGKDVLSSILNSGMFMKSKNKTVAAASSVVGIVANNEVRHLFQNALTLRNSVYKERLGEFASVIAEMNGPPKALLKLLREGKAHLEGGRKDIISLTKASVMESFKDKGKYLSELQKKAVTAVLLRTGAHVLLKDFDIKQMASLVTDQAVLDKAIADYENKISGIPLEIKSHLIHQSKSLGYHLVSGRSMSATVKLNAHNIVHMKEMVYEGRLSDAQTAALIPVVDSLVSLYALSYTSPTSKIALGTVMEVENVRTDGNGLQMVMLTQQHAEEMALSRLFHDSPVLMVKGYLPEIYNSHTDIRAANHGDGEKLMNLGYKLVGPLSLDPNDPFSEPQNLYVLRNGGMLPWLSGLFSFTNMRSKGTQNHGDNARGTQAILTRNAGRGKVAVGEGEAFDPRINQVDYMTATVNMDGVAVNARYMMHSTTKDGLLERENRFDEVLGALKGSIFDKEESKVHNEKAVQVLYADFKEGFTKKSTLYLEVSATSTDPELRDIWKMLPQSTKDAVKEIWGKEAMLVRPENLDIAFGYRKLSISSRFSRDVVDQTVIDKAMIGFVSLIMKTYGRTIKGMSPEEADKFAMSNAVTVRRLESMVQEIMHEVKDIYVVKNVITSLNNIKSNLSLLLLYGVNPIKGLRDMRIAWVGAEEHQRDSAALFKLRQQLDTGYITGDTSEIEAEIKRLEEALSNNPVAKVIELGMMPSIVEDVSTEEDPYTYKAALALKMDKYKAKINPKVLAVAKNIAMTKDTKVYQSLSRVVQLSDFVAKYALYQHLTTRETDPMTEEAAAHAASEAFINYDVPMHRGLEYMDSVGAFMFTKYFLRVQRVIRGRIKHAPGKLVMLLAAESFLGDLPTIMDASVILRAGNNPLQTGPLELLEAIPQLPTLFWLPGR